MSDGPLPHTVITRKAVTREARYEGVLGARELPQLSDVLAPVSDTPVHAVLRFYRDEEGRQVLAVKLAAKAQLECQRCLETFVTDVVGESELAIVRSDEEAQHLPARYEPLIALEETDLWRVVEEELALALPVVAYHDDGACSVAPVPQAPQIPAGSATADSEAPLQEEKSNPFQVLSTLLEQPEQDEESSKDGGQSPAQKERD